MEVFNRAAALEQLGGDDDALQKRLDTFQKDIHGDVRALKKALKKKRAHHIESRAEELQETAREIGAEGLEELARQLIESARAEDFENVETLLTHMGMELDWLLRILDENRCSGNL